MCLSDVTIAITSFLRPGYLRECLEGINENLPEVSVIVADDSDINIYVIAASKNKFLRLPFDSGLSAKRNAIIKHCTTPLVLLGCDDFNFRTKEARRGIERMLDVLKQDSSISIAGGRVDERKYEANLEYKSGESIIEHPANISTESYNLVDLTVNYFLARTEVLACFPWPEEMKIGGEHVCLFLDLKLAGKKVAWVSGANINTLCLGTGPDVQDPRYQSFRRRAINQGHPLMKKRYDIKKYIGLKGDIS